jgi:hypothetical protein
MKNLLIVLITIVLAVAASATTSGSVSAAEASPEASVEAVGVEVLGGPLRVVDFPLVFPSPFSPSRHNEIVIQYTLSEDADIDLIIISSNGEIIKKMSFQSGEEGAKGDLNKVVWDGQRDFGAPLANGIYLGLIMSPTERQVLSKFKLTAYN